MNMLDFTHFNAAFPTDGPSPYDPTFSRQIETFRKSFDGVLFIDRVLHRLGIKDASKVYPPHSSSALRSLHNQIITSSPGISPHARLSVLFYLLLDFDEKRGPRTSNLALSLADESGLPSNYQILMRGLWHMDRSEFKFALEYLCHPSLPSEFADDIITVLVKHAKKTEDDYSLPLAYYNTVQPVLKTGESLELLFGALARTSVTEALYFTRMWPENARRGLFERLVGSVIEGGRVWGGGGGSWLVCRWRGGRRSGLMSLWGVGRGGGGGGRVRGLLGS